MEYTFLITIARQEELPDVVDLVMHLDEHYGFNGLPRAKKEIVEQTIHENWLQAPCFLVKKDDKIIGFSSTTLGDYGWTDDKFLTTFVTYVLPEHRKIGIVKELYNAIKKYAKLQGVLLIDAHLATERVDGRRRLLLTQGFKESGFLLTYKG